MRGNRTVLIILAVVLLVAVVGGFFLWQTMGGDDDQDVELTETVEIPQTEIVVAAQNVGRGTQLLEEDGAMRLQPWPQDALPMEYFDDLEQVEGKYARTDIPLGMPILPSMLAEKGGRITYDGSVAALFGDEGKRAYVLPMDTQGAVAWALEPGDHVDVLATITLVAVDEEFQTPLPNLFMSLPTGGEGGASIEGTYGRFETLPTGELGLIYPNPYPNSAASNLLVQLTVQDAVVWHIGVWQEADQQPQQVTGAATAAPEEGDGGLLGAGGTTQQQATPIATPVTRSEIEPVTLLVTPQDALVLKYLQDMGADLDLVLRAAGDTTTVLTEPIMLRYILDRYQLPNQPPELPVAPPSPIAPKLELTPLAPEGGEVEE
ncbi:MAG: Flp pilus assembly protein CpaB [Anaerolineae bacterium]